MSSFDVRPPNPKLLSSQFSGGNQQKLVLAREISSMSKVLLVGQPTRGVDIGAIEFIHNTLIKMRDRGCAILLISAELEEILSLSDRIMVMNAGEVVGTVDKLDATKSILGKNDGWNCRWLRMLRYPVLNWKVTYNADIAPTCLCGYPHNTVSQSINGIICSRHHYRHYWRKPIFRFICYA